MNAVGGACVTGGDGVRGEEAEKNGVVKRVHTDWKKSRQSTVSTSISEPDLTQVSSNKTSL